jgi:hypothetical protein
MFAGVGRIPDLGGGAACAPFRFVLQLDFGLSTVPFPPRR